MIEKILQEIQALREDLQLSHKLLLTIDELAQVLGASPKTIRNQLSAGTFPIKPRRIGGRVFFRRRDVEEYVNSL